MSYVKLSKYHTLKSGMVPMMIRPSMTCSDFCARRTSLWSIGAVGESRVQWELYLSRGVERNMSGKVALSWVN